MNDGPSCSHSYPTKLAQSKGEARVLGMARATSR